MPNSSSNVGDQFYVTHCTPADSVLNDPGYTVRAASLAAGDRAVLQAAFRYPPYELPIEMWRDLPEVSGAPRRLALTDNSEDPDKRKQWVVHSAYLAKDTVGRDRSYFSHLVRMDAADPLAVLRSWGAEGGNAEDKGWVTSYPPGSPKKIDPFPIPKPKKELVGDAALTAFLGSNPPGPTDLNVAVCPPRLRASAADRRGVLARVLAAVLLLDAEPSDGRKRLYIHAEPGVIALTLYAAFRLLPADVTEGLTFSTFEPYQRNIRNYKLAKVVGTYLGPGKGLEADLGSTRGIALDTFDPRRSSAKLGERFAPVPGLDTLIDLAAQGEWGLLESVRTAMGRAAAGLGRANTAIASARRLAKVDAGDADIGDLLKIQSDPTDAAGLAARFKRAADAKKDAEEGTPLTEKAKAEVKVADKAWSVIKTAALTRDDVRKAFANLLAESERIKEVWEEAVGAIVTAKSKEDQDAHFRKWDAHWGLVREVLGDEKARKRLEVFVGREGNEDKLAKLTVDVRSKLRAACAEVGLSPPPRPLLVPVVAGELDALLRCPPDWAGYTCFVVLADDRHGWLAHVPAGDRAAMRKKAREYLCAAPAPAVAAYMSAARDFFDTDPSFITGLLGKYTPDAAGLMDKLLAAGALTPADWKRVYTTIGLMQGDWGERYLLEKDRLTNFLVGLGGEGHGAEVWTSYLDALTAALVSPDLIEADEDTDPAVVHAWERKVHAHLKAAAERLTAAGHRQVQAISREGVQRLAAANNLVKWTERPATAEKDGPEEVNVACEKFGVDKLALARVAYKKGGYDKLQLPAEVAKLDPIVQIFAACYPVDTQYHTARSAVNQWLKLSQDCPKQTRAVFQARFVIEVVPDTHYDDLLDEQRQVPFEPYAVTAIKQAKSQPKKGGARPKSRPPDDGAGPGLLPAENYGFTDDAVAEEAPDTAIAAAPTYVAHESRPAYKGPSKHEPKSSKGLIIGGAVLALVLGVGGVAVLVSGGKDGTSDQAKSDEKPKKNDEKKSITPKPPDKASEPEPKKPPELEPKKPPEPEPKKEPKPLKPSNAMLAVSAPVRYEQTKVAPSAALAVDVNSGIYKIGLPVRYPMTKSDTAPPKADPGAVADRVKAVIPKITNKLPHLRLWH